MEDTQESVLKEIRALSQHKNPKQAEDFLSSLIKLLHLSGFQSELFKSFESWFKIFTSFADQLLFNFPQLFVKLERFLIQNLTNPSPVLRNFSLFLLLDLCQKIPISRFQQICEYFIGVIQVEAQCNQQVLWFLSSPFAASYSLQFLFKNGLMEIARQVVFYLASNHEVFMFAKSQLGINPSMHLHYLLAKSGEGENLAVCFKSCASRVWAANPHSKKSKIEVQALLQYCLCSFIPSEVNNIDIIKSMIVSLTIISDFLDQNNDPEVTFMSHSLIDKLEPIHFLDQHQRKLSELLTKIRQKLPKKADWTASTEEISSFLESCTVQVDINQPLLEIKEKLGLLGPVSVGLKGAITAVEEILTHLNELNSVNT